MTQAVVIVLVCLAILLCIFLVIIFLLIFQNKRKAVQTEQDSAEYLIVYASQSGNTENFAQQTAQQLQSAGEQVQCMDIQFLTESHLHTAHKVLWMVSTYGEGDAPDTAQNFVQTFMSQKYDLAHLSYAVLASGDSRYPDFCRFGQRLNSWLQDQKAQPLFDMICVDQQAQTTLNVWTHCLEQQTRHELGNLNKEKEWTSVQLQKRELLNAGSQGNPLYHLEFSFEELQWQAGDILELRCANTVTEIEKFLNRYEQPASIDSVHKLQFKNLRQHPEQYRNESFSNWTERFENLSSRDYSIASIPEQKKIELVVRQEITETGLGLGSGWLTQGIERGQFADVRIRINPSFHAESDQKPCILIGNGSGIAGLMAHLHQQQRSLSFGNWLIFGERNKLTDSLFQTQLQQWQSNGVLTELDLVFSRDGNSLKYVQDVLKTRSELLKQMIDKGACIYVCGSIKGMGQAVDDTLTSILGADLLNDLKQQKRYKRDVY
ncbi:sulfite reductase subunit alpha [Acinetobacter chinensis]|uniref:NADPH--hemoprotein reductase n=1 Tax=Acinetobacter chinensis TaxID=2004650 RepID=A0ABU3WFU9_9GAMM|nr:sulfite reductase subunit alpha [Acinetobacter chinensis]MDV2468717.1 sulfite reductase subunit alpha [Acinetobacter chinensis]